MKEATDATSGAEHHGSPAGMLMFQRSNPRGEENELALLPNTLPHSLWAQILPSPSAWPVETPGITRPQACLQVSKMGRRQVCCSSRKTPGGGWSSGPGN